MTRNFKTSGIKANSLKICAVILFIALCLLTPDAFAQNGKNGTEYNAEQIIEIYKPSLVSIWMRDQNYYSYGLNDYSDTTILNGSGFIVSDDGLVCTNYHVVAQIDSIIVKTSDGVFHDADLVIADEQNDFAIIKIRNDDNKSFQVVRLGDSDELKQGQEVFAIGSPLGFEYTISSGIVAALRDNERVVFSDPYTYASKEKTFPKVIQITAAISPGNSGGGLFNRKGEVVGITTYTYSGYGNLNFAVSINPYKAVIELAKRTDIQRDDELISKKEETLFNSTYNLAANLKSSLVYDWYYSRYKDTMTKIDTFVVRQDSVNRVKFAKAESAFLKCIDMRPDSFFVYQDLLDMYVETDNFAKAEDFYLSIAQKFNSDSLLSSLSSSLASAYSTTKDYDKAILFYRKMLEQDPSLTSVQFQIANAYQQKNDSKKAIAEYKSLLLKDPNYVDAYAQLGKIYYDRNNLEKANEYFEKAYDYTISNEYYSADNSLIFFYRGMIAAAQGRKFDAMLAYIELKNAYDYSADGPKRKKELYEAIKKFDN